VSNLLNINPALLYINKRITVSDSYRALKATALSARHLFGSCAHLL